MTLTPHLPYRPLLWPDFVLDLQDILPELTADPVYAVGGAVRDALLNRPLKDLDLVVPGHAIKLARQLANRLDGKFFVLDAERDVGRALVPVDGETLVIDVAAFRGAGLLDDLQDRDFTINAMAVNLAADPNLLIDPLQGAADLKAKLLRRCSDWALSSDPARLLRAIRISVQLGLRVEPETLKDLKANVEALVQVSPERLRDELIKLLALPKAAGGLRVLEAVGLLRQVLPGDFSPAFPAADYLTQMIAAFVHNRMDVPSSFSIGSLIMEIDYLRDFIRAHLHFSWPNDRPHHALLVLGLLFSADSSAFEHNADSLRLSNDEIVRLGLMQQALAAFPDSAEVLILHRFWYRYGAAGVDACFLTLAWHLSEQGAEIKQQRWIALIDRVRYMLEAYFKRYDEIVAPPPLLSGNELISTFQLAPGPIIGQLLDHVREAQVTGAARTPDEALAAARAYLDHHQM